MRTIRLFLPLAMLLQVLALVPAQAQVAPKAYVIASGTKAWPLLCDDTSAPVLATVLGMLQQDIKNVTGAIPAMVTQRKAAGKFAIVAGTIENSVLIQELLASGKLQKAAALEQWEGYQVQMVAKPWPGMDAALVVTGHHARGVAYGCMHLSTLLGVSPWCWWADVPVQQQKELSLPLNYAAADYPRVKYRGIFINDEAPALSGWARQYFGGFKSGMYEKVFELMVRLRANYIWPAMWGNAFYDDDPKNADMANRYGIVIGTSHHEPLMRAHDEWRRYGKGPWNYEQNAKVLQDFWRQGLQRASTERIVTLGMRGDGDEPMSRETATELLETIVKDQRTIIASETGQPAEKTPQLWALYKEVQDYYDKGMRVPDDVTLLLCDDNWGNIRRLPPTDAPPRKGGYGIYYHFDYVGGPRNYKWLNTNHISRIWEQMHLAWQYNVRDIWIVNVGDIKPMELPISFFLDYAWNPEQIGPTDLMAYTEAWAAAQFGPRHAKEIAALLDGYSKINSRRKPELLDHRTFLLQAGEWDRAVAEYNALHTLAEEVSKHLPQQMQDAYFQLVQHPVMACANLYELYHATAYNHYWAEQNSLYANYFADKVAEKYLADSLITIRYHKLGNGKWNHMMSQTHIGYTGWQQPRYNAMPKVSRIAPEGQAIGTPSMAELHPFAASYGGAKAPAGQAATTAIDASQYTAMYAPRGHHWQVLPGHGRVGHAITLFPVTHASFVQDGAQAPWLEYQVALPKAGPLHWKAHFSPTLNFLHLPEGLEFEVAINGGNPRRYSLNKQDNIGRVWDRWVANNCITISDSLPDVAAGTVTIRYSPLHPGIVLQSWQMGSEVPPATYLENLNVNFTIIEKKVL